MGGIRGVVYIHVLWGGFSVFFQPEEWMEETGGDQSKHIRQRDASEHSLASADFTAFCVLSTLLEEIGAI
jgi:hypothetical protein